MSQTIQKDEEVKAIYTVNENPEIHQKHINVLGKHLNLTKHQLITIVLLSLFFFLTSSYYSLVSVLHIKPFNDV